MAPRFYYFDVGINNFLLKRGLLQQGSPEYGKLFEHLIMNELYAYTKYNDDIKRLSYWRTTSGFEVDAVLGDAELAVEIKSSKEVHNHHLKGLKAFSEEYPNARKIVVSNEPYSRLVNEIEIIPVNDFLVRLWEGGII